MTALAFVLRPLHVLALLHATQVAGVTVHDVAPHVASMAYRFVGSSVVAKATPPPLLMFL